MTGATARSNIINVHEEFGGYNVSGCIKYAVQGCKRKGPTVYDKYTAWSKWLKELISTE